ncbi:hypothetical protein K438DRAFT_1607296, partial [Mycena galopus ATCC 62051]
SAVVAGLLGGEIYVAETVDPGKIGGCAVWFGPGRGLYDRYVQYPKSSFEPTNLRRPDQRKHSLEPLMASFDKELRDWRLNTVGSSPSDLAAWNLQTFGVDPTYHHQGVAKLLVNTIAEKARTSQPHAAFARRCPTYVDVSFFLP